MITVDSFPGMNPYLESGMWQGFHSKLAVACAEALNEVLPPDLVADIEVNIVSNSLTTELKSRSRPDAYVYRPPGSYQAEEPPAAYGNTSVATERITLAPIEQTKVYSVKIFPAATGWDGELIGVVEVLSPVNKKPGKGLESYRAKRDNYRAAGIHLLEIDLLRGGTRPFVKATWNEYTYSIQLLNSRTNVLTFFGLFIHSPLPTVTFPLRTTDEPVKLDLQQVLRRVFKMSRYGSTFDYSAPIPGPPLSTKDADFLKSLESL